MAAMAITDKEDPGVTREQLAAHLAGCLNCQQQLKDLQAFDQLLSAHTLAEPRVELWPAVETRLAKRKSSSLGWQPFALIGLLLITHKLLEMLPTQDPGMVFKLVPLVIVTLLFVLIRENPFRINTEMVLEGRS